MEEKTKFESIVKSEVPIIESQVEIRSEEVDEIMGKSPAWIISWGITVIFIVVAALLIGSYFFKYPDVINSTIVVTSENIPVTMVAKTSGKIERLFVKDKQFVNKNEVLALIENPTNYNDVVKLKQQLDSFKILTNSFKKYDSISYINFDKNYQLGSLQTDYLGLLKNLLDYQIFIKMDYQHKKIKSIKQQIGKYYSLNSKLIKQNKLKSEELDITIIQYQRDSSLMNDKTISQVDFEKSKNMLLQQKYAFENTRTAIDNSSIQILQLEQSVLDIQQQYDEQKKQFELSIEQSFNNLFNQIKTWEQTYLIIAPINGTVTFNLYWSENQNVVAGDKVITIVPNVPTRMLGKILLPIQGSGKVKAGQRVNIKFINYPYMEYGMVRGVIKSISLLASDNNYTVEVDLPDGLKTNYGKVLDFNQEMQGSAEIITEDIKLLERFLNPIKSLIKK